VVEINVVNPDIVPRRSMITLLHDLHISSEICAEKTRTLYMQISLLLVLYTSFINIEYTTAENSTVSV